MMNQMMRPVQQTSVPSMMAQTVVDVRNGNHGEPRGSPQAPFYSPGEAGSQRMSGLKLPVADRQVQSEMWLKPQQPQQPMMNLQPMTMPGMMQQPQEVDGCYCQMDGQWQMGQMGVSMMPLYWPASPPHQQQDVSGMVWSPTAINQCNSRPFERTLTSQSTAYCSTGSSSGSPSQPATPKAGQLDLRVSAGQLPFEEDSPCMLWPSTPDSSPENSPRGPRPEQMLPAFPAELCQPDPFVQASMPLSHQLPPPAAADQLGEAECQALCSRMNSDANERQVLLEWLVSGAAWTLATTSSGCHIMQTALELADGPTQAALAEQLRGHVREASMSPHANHVLQKCVELMSPDRLQFIVHEMRGHAVNAARHRYGCRVLERIIENCPAWQTEDLVEELLTGVTQLCRHTFGNFVVQHVLQHGTPPQRHRICEVVHADVQRLARHRVASHVVRCALVHCAQEDRQRLINTIRADAGQLSDLAHHHCGSFVVREMRRELRR